MITILKGFYCYKTKESADFPAKDKVCLCFLDTVNQPLAGELAMEVSIDREKIYPVKFADDDELKKYIGKRISVDTGLFNGRPYLKSVDKI